MYHFFVTRLDIQKIIRRRDYCCWKLLSKMDWSAYDLVRFLNPSLNIGRMV